MRTNDWQNGVWTAVETIEEILSCCEQGLHALKKLTMGDFPPKMPPQHLDRIEPGTVGGQIGVNGTSLSSTGFQPKDEEGASRLEHHCRGIIGMVNPHL